MLNFRNHREVIRALVTTLDLSKLWCAISSNQRDWYENDWRFSGHEFLSMLQQFPRLKYVILDGLSGFTRQGWSVAIEPTALDTSIMDLLASTSTLEPSGTQSASPTAAHGHPRLSGTLKFPSLSHTASYNELVLLILRIASRASSMAASSTPMSGTVVLPAKHALFEPNLLSLNGCRDLNCIMVLTYETVLNLTYLDITNTARPASWLPFRNLQLKSLRVLKLGGLGLTDNNLVQILQAVSKSLWSLDVSNNILTDSIASVLLRRMLGNLPHVKDSYGSENINDKYLFDDPPVYQLYTGTQGAVTDAVAFRKDDKLGVLSCLRPHTQLPDGLEPFMQSTGLTHLHIHTNRLTCSGVRCLLSSTNRLQFLDAGTVPCSQYYSQTNTAIFLDASETSTRLSHLRIHHSIVTGTPNIASSPTTTPEMSDLVRMELIGEERQHDHILFTPQSNYRLHTLILTSIPAKSSGFIVRKLCTFLRQCRNQELTIQHVFSNSPWPSHRRAPPPLQGLRVLVLEILPAVKVEIADTFLAESVGDFSFFDMPGITDTSKGKNKEKSISDREQGVQDEQHIIYDVAEELRKFRAIEADKWGGVLKLVCSQ